MPEREKDRQACPAPITLYFTSPTVMMGVEAHMVSEEELQRQGFRKIKSTYSSRCSFCGQPFSSGEEIYWKRDEGSTVCCRRCWDKKGRTVRCPNCGTQFEVYEPDQRPKREIQHDDTTDSSVYVPE
jgi:hypothetical protein